MKIPSKITNFLVYSIGQSINLLSPLIVMPHLMRICNEDGFGKIGIAFSICLILCCIVDYSSYLNGTKEIVINKRNILYINQRIGDIYSYKMIIFLTFLGFLFIGILLFPNFYEKKLLFLSLPIVISQLVNPNWFLQGLEKFKQIAFLNIISKIIYIACIFYFIKTKEDYVWANFFLGISGIIVYTFYIFFYIKKYKLRFKLSNISNGIKILKTDYSICLSEFCLSLYQYFPILIVGYFTGPSTAGLYRVIEQIFSVFRTFTFMFFNFSYPTVCYDIEKNLKKGLKIWKLYHLVNFTFISIGVVSVFFAKDFIFNYFHIALEDRNLLIDILKIALIVPLLLVISQAFRQLMFALNLTRMYTYIIYLTCSMSIIFLGILVHHFGLKGAFISMIFIEIIVITLYSTNILKKLKA
ncbi:oligosaccharide flippase family protein [Empedobacter falsenii]